MYGFACERRGFTRCVRGEYENERIVKVLMSKGGIDAVGQENILHSLGFVWWLFIRVCLVPCDGVDFVP